MSSLKKAVVIAVIHVAIVSTLGAKLLYDRATRPRVWVRTQNYDPNLPIRGRYVALRPVFDDPQPPKTMAQDREYLTGKLGVRDGRVTVEITDTGWYRSEGIPLLRMKDGDRAVLTTYEPVLYFIPDTAKDPTRLEQGQELWVEVTIPKKGPPRPLQLALKQGEQFKVLDLD